MSLRYFQCEKCKEIYAGRTDNEQIRCGALVGWITKNGEEVPYGCNGVMKELTREEANEIVSNMR